MQNLYDKLLKTFKYMNAKVKRYSLNSIDNRNTYVGNNAGSFTFNVFVIGHR